MALRSRRPLRWRPDPAPRPLSQTANRSCPRINLHGLGSLRHENVIFPAGRRKDIFVPPYAAAIASFWKARLASGPRAAERPSLQHLLGNASLPFDLARPWARAPHLAQAIRGDGRRFLLISGLARKERVWGKR